MKTANALDFLRSQLKADKQFKSALALRAELSHKLTTLRRASNPTGNPILELAHDLSERLNTAQVDINLLQQLIQLLSSEAFADRAERIADYVGVADSDENRKIITKLVRQLTTENDELVPFAEFSQRLSREIFGIVITAHPTFALSAKHFAVLSQFATNQSTSGGELGAEQIAALSKFITEQPHKPDRQIDLSNEHAQSLDAIRAIRQAMREVYTVVLDVASEVYPQRWTELSPCLISTASWVGYDLDGRTDITWADTLRARMQVKIIQLRYYGETIDGLVSSFKNSSPKLLDICNLVKNKLAEALVGLNKEVSSLENNLSSSQLKALSQQIIANKGKRLCDSAEIINSLSQAIALADDYVLKRSLVILRAEVTSYGFTASHMHVRLNSNQLHNAIRNNIGMEGEPDDPGRRRGNFRALSNLLDEVKPIRINFGTLVAENTTAKRLFMLIAQLIKYVDSSVPIRFLIAECNTPFTVLTALYYARLFGVAHLLDISPLFETGTALERGSKVIADLLNNKHYRKYIKQRGRLCIQTGFSDAGRYLGQVSASLAIERLHVQLARLLVANGMHGIEVVIFDTHGESIGRGAHPLSFVDRLNYVFSPMARNLFKLNKIAFKHEMSFQGGDGYLYFGTPKLALSTITRLLEHNVVGGSQSSEDSFYVNTDYSLDFFLTLKGFHEQTFARRDYADFLGSFGTNLLYQTGSRKNQRQHEKKHGIDRHGHPSQIRAIPHNAILQQLGYLVNSVGGMGNAINRDVASFVNLYHSSDRVRRFLSLAIYARDLSNLSTPEAYAALFNPRYWLAKAYAAKSTPRSSELLKLANFVNLNRRYDGMSKMLHTLREDALNLYVGVGALNIKELKSPVNPRRRTNLALLHVIRICLIQEIFVLATRIPAFSKRDDLTLEELVQHIVAMDVPKAMQELAITFPVCEKKINFDADDYGEPSDYSDDENRDYSQEHQQIFMPIAKLYDLCCRISVAITNNIGAHG